MFDVGFWELVLIALVALLVFGPERLPRLVREVALWVRKARSVVAAAKSEIDQELQLHDLRQSFEEKRKKLERDMQSFSGAPQNLLTGETPQNDADKQGMEAEHDRE